MTHHTPQLSPAAATSPACDIAVPYVDLALQHRDIKDELLAAVASVIDTGQFVLGPQVAEFEHKLAALCNVKHAVAVNSGTDALILSLRALGIGQGHEVITAPNSFIASASAIALAGATPVFADIDQHGLIDPAKIQDAITPRTRAILPVHLTGRAADMTAINAIARQHDLYVIEDAAQAILAQHQGQPVGSLSHAGCFSLHPLKTLNALGDGGVITTHSDDLAASLRKLRNLGLRSREQCDTWASNSRLDSIQAAMLCVKLNHLHRWTQKRIDHATFYQQALAHLPQVRCPQHDPQGLAVYHTFVIRAKQRDQLQQYLTSRNVGSAIHYPIPIHLQNVASPLGYTQGSFPIAEAHARQILSLPIYPELTQHQLRHVVQCITDFYTANP